MCIIVVKYPDRKMPAKEILARCYEGNSDGAGFMWSDGAAVHINKGYFDFEVFHKQVLEVPDDSPLVMHFRIKTHGKIVPGLCHPFPVSDDLAEMRERNFDCAIGMAHNGVIKVSKTSDSVSDSMEFARMLSVSGMAEVAMTSPEGADLLDMVVDPCRVVLLDRSGTMNLYGPSWEEDKGVWYSNSSYKIVRRAQTQTQYTSVAAKPYTREPTSSYYSPYARPQDLKDNMLIEEGLCPWCFGPLDCDECVSCGVKWAEG